jgi:hypothetical protein
MGQILSGTWVDSVSHSVFWSQYTNQAQSPRGTSVTMRAATPAPARWNFVAAEVVGEEE